jgi:hypothetical protein
VSGGTYRDPGGWVVDVPQGWRAVPFHLSGATPAEGVQISNIAVPPPHAVSGVPLQITPTGLPADGVGIIIATDRGPVRYGLHGTKIWTPPLSYDELSQGSAPAGGQLVDVGWFSGNGRTFSLTIRWGSDAWNDRNIPEVMRLVRSIGFT